MLEGVDSRLLVDEQVRLKSINGNADEPVVVQSRHLSFEAFHCEDKVVDISA